MPFAWQMLFWYTSVYDVACVSKGVEQNGHPFLYDDYDTNVLFVRQNICDTKMMTKNRQPKASKKLLVDGINTIRIISGIR